METTKEAAIKYAEKIAQDEVKKMYSRTDFEAGVNWKEQQQLSQFEQIKTALEQIVTIENDHAPYFRSYHERCVEIASEALASFTETNEKP